MSSEEVHSSGPDQRETQITSDRESELVRRATRNRDKLSSPEDLEPTRRRRQKTRESSERRERTKDIRLAEEQLDRAIRTTPLTDLRGHLYHYHLVTEQKDQEIKDAVKWELKLDSALNSRPILLRVNTSPDEVTTISVFDEATQAQIARIRLDQDDDGKIIAVKTFDDVIQRLRKAVGN